MSPPEDSFSIARRALEIESDNLGLNHRAFLGSHAFTSHLHGLEQEIISRYNCTGVGVVMVAALAFDEGLPTLTAGPLVAIARFARANWYRELVYRLGCAAGAARRALQEAGKDPGPKGQWRSLANSRLPERSLALAAGLGSRGRSGLLLVPGAGPGVVLGLLLMPDIFGEVDLGAEATGAEDKPGSASRSFSSCGSCQACVDACPTGALSVEGRFDRERCIQHWASRAGELPDLLEERWGDRLYGCDSCTESCPRFGNRSSIVPTRGLLGPGVPAAEIAAASDEEIRARFKGSALGQTWIEAAALRRNARLCLRAKAGKVSGGAFDANGQDL